jgi:hypothetical protein
MVSRLAVILALAVPAGAALTLGTPAQWDVFTNNFATDLAPLVVLFGEQATKQFLSESTGILDPIIFGVAPIGILTAVVSVIRLLGSASLRAFIGRAQEPYAEAQVELCSSTSDDVCELWSNGGICRVIGRPSILEYFYMKGENRFYPEFNDKGIQEPGPCRIYLAREALRGALRLGETKPAGTTIKPAWVWVETGAMCQSQGSKDVEHGLRTLRTLFAPYPNLSLNFGIRSVSPFWRRAAAMTGVTLQSSFFVYATWANFYDPALYDEGDQPQLWSFCLATSGTALLASGMILSAWLIEHKSSGRTFECEVTTPEVLPTTLELGH